MKKGIYSLFAFFVILLASCDSKEMLYTGDSYVMFSDSSLIMPVTVNVEDTFNITVSTTNINETDRIYVVNVDIDHSNAIEGYHFDLVSKNVLIKAGERTGKVTMKAYYDHMDRSDSLAVTLQLLNNNELFNIYGNKTNVRLYKCYPFNIDDYVGDLRMTCTFPFSDDRKDILLKSEKIDDHTLLVKKPFDDNYDLKLNFLNTAENPLNNEVTVIEQEVFLDSGYGQVFAQTVSSEQSFYIAADRGFVLYLNMFLPKVGSFGTYLYIFKWISPYEAEADRNGVTAPYKASTHFNGYSINKIID